MGENGHMVKVVIGVLAAVLLVGACASGGAGVTDSSEFVAVPMAAAAPSAGSVATDHRLGPNDKLRVNVFRRPELSVDGAVVDSRGQIVMPLLGPIDVAGKTRDELTAQLTAELSRDIVNPNVTVTILEAVSERVTLDGAVKQPGLFTVNGPATLLQVITLGGGPLKEADLRKVLVKRTSDDVVTFAKFDLDAIRKGRAPDPQILPGDTIVVENSRMKSAWSQILTSIPVVGIFNTL